MTHWRNTMSNGRNPLAPQPPDFESMVWKCPCCEQKRTDKFIKVFAHDVGTLFGFDVGVMFVNVKYCVDMPGCKEKAFNRGWVINHFFKKFADDNPNKVNIPQP